MNGGDIPINASNGWLRRSFDVVDSRGGGGGRGDGGGGGGGGGAILHTPGFA